MAMDKLTLTLLVASIGFAGCADAGDGDTGNAKIAGAPQQLEVQAGKIDGTAAKSTDLRLLNCQLEYEAFAPAFAVKPAASFEVTFGEVENQGARASDGAFTLVASTNPHPPYNLSFVVQIVDEARKGSISYVVLPRPHVGGEFLFELGADIPPVTFPDGTTFDNLRGYCSIRNP
jgi:hypothetical protein